MALSKTFSFLSFLLLGSSLAALAASAACGDDEATVRERPFGVGDGGADVDAGPACGLTLPDTYPIGTFDTSALEELGLRKRFDDFLGPMKTVEAQAADGGTPTAITQAQLETLYGTGTPSLKATTTPYFQQKVAPLLTAYETALRDGTYVPGVPDAGAGGDKGGVFGGFVLDPTGLDLRQVIEQGTYAAAFYNQAVSLIDLGVFTVGTVDRLIAAFGAHPTFPNNPDAQQNRDVNAAANAARRDSKSAANVGPYQRIRTAMITARAAIEKGADCDAVRDTALTTFLNEWERSNYATVIHELSDTVGKLGAAAPAAPPDPAWFHSFGAAVGLTSGFKTIKQARRIITDAQIDSILQDLLAPDGVPSEAYKLETARTDASTRLGNAIKRIQDVYRFTNDEVASFKQNN